jgi:hypothetical protein
MISEGHFRHIVLLNNMALTIPKPVECGDKALKVGRCELKIRHNWRFCDIAIMCFTAISHVAVAGTRANCSLLITVFLRDSLSSPDGENVF